MNACPNDEVWVISRGFLIDAKGKLRQFEHAGKVLRKKPSTMQGKSYLERKDKSSFSAVVLWSSWSESESNDGSSKENTPMPSLYQRSVKRSTVKIVTCHLFHLSKMKAPTPLPTISFPITKIAISCPTKLVSIHTTRKVMHSLSNTTVFENRNI